MKAVAGILGYEIKEKAPMVAVIRCNGTCEARPKINEYDGCVYSIKYNGTTKPPTYLTLLYAPGGKREITFAPIAKITSKLIEALPNVEILHFDEATLEFEDYAITGSPNLKEVYINQNAKVSSKAFDDLPADCQIIRYDPIQTGIRPIYM